MKFRATNTASDLYLMKMGIKFLVLQSLPVAMFSKWGGRCACHPWIQVHTSRSLGMTGLQSSCLGSLSVFFQLICFFLLDLFCILFLFVRLQFSSILEEDIIGFCMSPMSYLHFESQFKGYFSNSFNSNSFLEPKEYLYPEDINSLEESSREHINRAYIYLDHNPVLLMYYVM